MTKKTIAIGLAVVALTLGVAAPAAAAQPTVKVQATMVANTPSFFCMLFGWC